MTILSISLASLLTLALLLLLVPLVMSNKLNQQRSTKLAFIGIAVFVPLLSVGGYFILGMPGFAEQSNTKDAAPLITLVDKLEEKLAKNPKDVNGWLLLGRSRMVDEDYQKAIFAFEKALAIEPNNLTALLPLADALTITQAGNLSGRPYELLQKAYSINPSSQMTLWLLGMAERQKGNLEQAKKYWQTLYQIVPNGSEDQTSIAKLLKSIGASTENLVVNNKLPEPTPKKTNSTPTKTNADSLITDNQITIKLVFNKEVQQSISQATVFIYAKQPQGMPMPIAAKRFPGSQLPTDIHLTNKDELMPSRKLNNYKELIIGIKISQGDASNNNVLFKQEQLISYPGQANFIIKF